MMWCVPQEYYYGIGGRKHYTAARENHLDTAKMAGVRSEIVTAPNTAMTIAHIYCLLTKCQALCEALYKHYLI